MRSEASGLVTSRGSVRIAARVPRALVVLGFVAVTAAAGADDSDLFQTSVAPNVVLMVDNSGSMNHVVLHPSFDPEEESSCGCFSESTHYVRGSYSWGGFDSLITFPPLCKRTFKSAVKGNIIRVYCGLEDSQDQINDILNALKVLK